MIRRSLPLVLSLLMAGGLCRAASAAEGPKATGGSSTAIPASAPPQISTDRPDISDSTTVVGRGVWQVESGIAFERDGAGSAATRTLFGPTTMVRVGVSDRLELRASADGYVSSRPVTASGSRAHGAGDVSIGVKYVLVTQSRAGVDLAVIPALSLPTGSAAISSGGYDPTVKLAWARDLPRGFGVSGNVNIVSTTDGERFTSREVTCSVGHDLSGGWAGYWEVYRASALQPHGSPAWVVDTGVMHPLGRNAQIDFSLGHGVNAAAPRWFAAIGFSMRGPFGRR